TFVWGAACWLAITIVLLMDCGFVAWLIDRQRGPPLGVRLGLFFVPAAVAGMAALRVGLLPQPSRLPATLAAPCGADKMPQFDHRLISAVQLNQPDAQLEGMSRELVAMVTREAEKLTQRVGGFTQVADHRRIIWTGLTLVPVFFLFVAPFLIWPGVCF